MVVEDSSPRATPPADQVAGSAPPAVPLARRVASRPWLIAGAAAALIPMLRMARSVAAGSDVQYADYWLMLPEVLSRGGGLKVGGLFTFSNDHAVVIPKFLYWLNARVASGSNTTLGVVVIAIAAAQVAVVWSMLRRAPLSDAARAGMLVLASALIFNRIGAWNFLKAMSGTAWLTANTFAVVAVALRSRGRVWTSLGVGVLASMSYGTGLAVWPALVVTGLAVDRSTAHRRITMAVGGLVACGYLALRSTSDDRSQTVEGPIRIVRFTAEVLGGSLVPFDSGLVEWVGFAIVGVGVGATVAVVKSGRERVAAPWFGLIAFGVSAAATVAVGRSYSIFGVGSNRHASLGSIAILGIVGLIAIVVREPLLRRTRGAAGPTLPSLAGACALLALIGTVAATSSRDLDQAQLTEARQDRFAIELRFGLASGTQGQLGFLGTIPEGIEDLLERNGHVPFDGRERFDCGHAGERIDVDGLDQGLPDDVEMMQPSGPQGIERSRQSSGWINDPDDRVACILVADPSGLVVGAGTIGAAANGFGPGHGLDGDRPDGWSEGYVIVRPADATDASVVVVLDDGTMVVVPLSI